MIQMSIAMKIHGHVGTGDARKGLIEERLNVKKLGGLRSCRVTKRPWVPFLMVFP